MSKNVKKTTKELKRPQGEEPNENEAKNVERDNPQDVSPPTVQDQISEIVSKLNERSQSLQALQNVQGILASLSHSLGLDDDDKQSRSSEDVGNHYEDDGYMAEGAEDNETADKDADAEDNDSDLLESRNEPASDYGENLSEAVAKSFSSIVSNKEKTGKWKDSQGALEKKRKRNKRRRTRSERNLLAGKAVGTPSSQTTQVVTVGEEADVIDAEIDRVLEEKANKNNLSATNVKSIIHHVITNNMVQKMIMTAMKRKAESAEAGEGGSSDEDGLVGPKMTRAKTKELLENKQISLWPNVYSPVKISKKPVSETHMLIQHDLPEDSSGDEYVPKETDISEMIHSDDESSMASSHTSDIGSPAPVIAKQQRVIRRRSLQINETPPISDNDSLFKTPPPRPGIKKTQEESAVSRRTRSKFPLKDTPLEELERQLNPPDITNDMYDWGTETDNEDYLDFLKDFLNPGQNQNDQNEMDDEADPEYNVMEDDEDVHDREELRMDRAVKVPKKELTQLIAELFEPGMLSGDDMEDHDLATLTGITPLVNDCQTVDATAIDIGTPFLETSSKYVQNKSCQFNTSSSSVDIPDNSKSSTTTPIIYEVKPSEETVAQNRDSENYVEEVVISEAPSTSGVAIESVEVLPVPIPVCDDKGDPLFREQDLRLLHHQMRQHIQLLAQSYVLTFSNEHSILKNIAKTAKSMVIELKNFSAINGARTKSNFAVCNLEPAWNIVNFWPHKFLQNSPIKKKILEEKYISDSGVDGDEGKRGKLNHFPRHVVKVIAESPAFLYNTLLPECYNQKSAQARCTFTFHEDALMVMALDEFKDQKKSVAQLADIITNVLLVVRPPKQVYHRIRNLRKSASDQAYCDPIIKKYFAEGILPKVDHTVPEVADAQPLIQRSREGLSTQWACLLQHLEGSPTYQWEEKLTNDPLAKSMTQKWNNKRNIGRVKDRLTDDDTQPGCSTRAGTIDKVFPNGTFQIENTDPNMEAIPLLNANGKPGAIIYIPKLALHPLAVQGSPLGQGSLANGMIQPREAFEAGGEPRQGIIQSASSPGINLIGIQHLIRRSQKTPMKITSNDTNNAYAPSSANIPIPAGVGYHVVQPVGKPFSLNELGCSFPAGRHGSDQIIDLSTLQTPVKNIIFQKAAEAQNEGQEEVHEEHQEDADIDDDDDDASCIIVDEDTVAELTSEEEYEFEPNTSRQDQEVITLDSDSDNDVEQKEQKITSGGSDANEEKTSSHSNTESGSTSGSNNHGTATEGSHSSTAVATQSFTLSRTSSRPRKGDSDEDNEKKGGRKRSLPKDYDKDEGTEGSSKESGENSSPEKDKLPKRPSVIVSVSSNSPGSSQIQKPIPSTSSHQPQSSCNNNKPLNKKAKRSPGNPQASTRRSSKYNVTPPEKLLNDEPTGFDDVADAYMEAYLAKVQSTTEKNHPGLHSAFLQTLMEAGAGPVNQTELHSKIKVLFKDYPDLLREFESFLDPTLDEGNDPSNISGSSSHDDTVAEMEFLQKIEQFTENCPHLKGKVINKIKSLREKPNLTEKDVANALEHFFSGNSVMMQSFKSLLPGVYKPHSTSSGMDFEEIELDMDDPPRDNDDFEIVKLPDEATVPATATCPCICHTKTSDPAFSSRSKHCRKCSLKFQDGKIFIHNGRVLRPVSVESKAPASETTALFDAS